MVAADPSAPRFGGLTGRPLSICVTIVATCGFLLFGYDRERSLSIQDAVPVFLTKLQRESCLVSLPDRSSTTSSPPLLATRQFKDLSLPFMKLVSPKLEAVTLMRREWLTLFYQDVLLALSSSYMSVTDLDVDVLSFLELPSCALVSLSK